MENMMDALQLKKVMLDAMIYIKENGADDLGAGICDSVVEYIDESGVNLEDNWREAYRVIESLSPEWPKFSGVVGHPVPSTNDELTPKGMFGHATDYGELWVGEYGALRMELLDFLIEQLTLEVGEYSEH